MSLYPLALPNIPSKVAHLSTGPVGICFCPVGITNVPLDPIMLNDEVACCPTTLHKQASTCNMKQAS